MKSIHKIFLLALGVYTSAFSQITEITRLPVQDNSQSIKESAPVWISENEIMIFYVNETKDTIFSTQSTDKGENWSQPKFQFKVELFQQTQELIYPTVLKTKSGRLVFAWSVQSEGINLTYSDNNGFTWSPIQIILGTGAPSTVVKKLCNIKLSQLTDHSIVLCFNPVNVGRELYYKSSIDNGESWSESSMKIVGSGYYWFSDHSIISADSGRLICVFSLKRLSQPNYNIYSMFSNDNGISWGDTVRITGGNFIEHSPRISKDKNGYLWLTYQRIDTISYSSRYSYEYSKLIKNDIYYKKSTDNGLNWEAEERFTQYIGDNNYLSFATDGEFPLLTFSTNRYSQQYQLAFGSPGLSQDLFTPPVIVRMLVTAPEPGTHSVTINATVLDDEEVGEVFALLPDSTLLELFDDGNHDDVQAGDFIFGNSVNVSNISFLENGLFDLNKILMPFNNTGIIANVAVEVPVAESVIAKDIQLNTTVRSEGLKARIQEGGMYDEGSFLFSGGFFLSGLSDAEMWANGVASASRIGDYRPGKIAMGPNDPLNVIYTVFASDPPFGYSWQRWKDAVNLGADFYDGDGDGIYNPVDKNWNGIWDPDEDMPDLLGDQTSWCVFNDGVPDSLRQFRVDPQGIEIHQTLFATNKLGLDEVIFARYKIINKGTVVDVMDSVYFSLWSDPDLGNWNDAYLDDLVGTDTTLNSIYIYNDGYDNHYGENPPSMFQTFLQGPLVETSNPLDTAFNNKGSLLGSDKFTGWKNLDITSSRHFMKSHMTLGDPNSSYEARNYMLGLLKDGTQINPCTWPYSKVTGGVDCNLVNPLFVYSGDPVDDIGWINNFSTDQRLMANVGPFTLEKDKPVTIIGAYIVGRGTDPLNSISVTRENVRRAIEEYKNNFSSLAYNPGEPTNPVTSYILYQNYPNPFNSTTTIRYELPQDGVVTIEVFDILGQKVKTILNEFKRADRYEITFNSTGLASGVYIYQLRVNDFITSKKTVLLR